MPVTAKLSRKFYEKFGDDIANELVEWFNAVDATYRSDLRELNELNFERFDAKLEQRAVELAARIDRMATELNTKIDRVAAELNAKIDRVPAELNARIEHLAVEFKAELTGLESKLDKRLAEMRADIETRMIRWMFGFWIAQAATTVGLVFGVLKLLHP